jgi:hypothetical protein
MVYILYCFHFATIVICVLRQLAFHISISFLQTTKPLHQWHIANLILKLYVLTNFRRSYSPFNAGKRVSFYAKITKNNIHFSLILYKILML